MLNKSMPRYALSQIKQSFPSLRKMTIGILGLTYRPGVKETAFSGALDLLELLKTESSLVYGYDPLLDENEIIGLGFNYKKEMSNLDGIILHTEHPEFSDINFHEISTLKFVYDGRNLYPKLKKTKHSFIYLNILWINVILRLLSDLKNMDSMFLQPHLPLLKKQLANFVLLTKAKRWNFV